MVIVNLIGVAIIGLIVWWFWLYEPKNVSLKGDNLVITVESGTYTPSHIQLDRRKPATLTFLRKDASPCAEVLLIPDLEISEALPLNKPVTIDLPELDPGNYAFHCQMQMYKGELTVT